jgi:hypothetical protein
VRTTTPGGTPHVVEETRLSAPHTLQCIGDQVPLYVPRVPHVVVQERGPTRDPPQPASIDMGLNVGNEVSLMHVADDTGDALHRPEVHLTDAIVWRLIWQCLVVQIHGWDFVLG